MGTRTPCGKRIMRHIDIKDQTGCWDWFGAVDCQNNPVILNDEVDGIRRLIRVRRKLMWDLTGEDPGRRPVFPTCGSRMCCNPDHMVVGIEHDIQDRICHRGHRVTPENGIKRGNHLICRECHRLTNRLRMKRIYVPKEKRNAETEDV